MKVLLVYYGIFFVYYGVDNSASGQFFNFAPSTPPRQFQSITFDLVHRGSFNLTDCMKELINCWEIVKPDILCSEGVSFESVCGLVARDCDDAGRAWKERGENPIFESMCRYYDGAT